MDREQELAVAVQVAAELVALSPTPEHRGHLIAAFRAWAAAAEDKERGR